MSSYHHVLAMKAAFFRNVSGRICTWLKTCYSV